MRRPAIIGVLMLLVIGLAAGAWLMLRPSDGPAPVAVLSDNQAAPRDSEAGTLETPADKPEPAKPAPVEPSAPARQPEAVAETTPGEAPPAEASGIEIAGRVGNRFSEPLQAHVSLYYGSEDDPKQSTACAQDGTFRFTLADTTEIPAGAYVMTECEGYTTHRDPAEASMAITLLLSVLTRVNVRIEGANCTPDSAWLIWEGDTADRQEGESFEQGVARIELRRGRNAGDCRVFCHWFGQLAQSDVMTVEAGKSYDVTLKVPQGAELLVTVIGPDGLPVPGAKIEVSEAYDKTMVGHTGEGGDVLFTGVSAPSQWIVELKQIKGAQCVTDEQAAEFTTRADHHEVRFDLTNTGIVDCLLTANGQSISSIDITPIEPSGEVNRYLWLENSDDELSRIYGLKPGRYKVEASGWQTDNTYEAEFEVLAMPAISLWKKDFKTHTLTVHVTGAGTSALRASYTAGGFAEVHEVDPQPTGEFVIAGLGSGNYEVRVHGSGWASDVVNVNPGTQSELTIDVVAAGTLKLIPRGEAAYRLGITGIEPARAKVSVQGQQSRGADTLLLPPGRYTVAEEWMGGLWVPFEVTVTAGETAECKYGPEYVSTLRMRSRDRESLWGHDIAIEKDGVPLRTHQTQTWAGGDEYYSADFEAEGRLILRIKGTGIEDYEREFEVKRGETVSLEIELKPKE